MKFLGPRERVMVIWFPTLQMRKKTMFHFSFTQNRSYLGVKPEFKAVPRAGNLVQCRGLVYIQPHVH